MTVVNVPYRVGTLTNRLLLVNTVTVIPKWDGYIGEISLIHRFRDTCQHFRRKSRVSSREIAVTVGNVPHCDDTLTNMLLEVKSVVNILYLDG